MVGFKSRYEGPGRPFDSQPDYSSRSGDERSTADQSRKVTMDMDKFVGRECLDYWLTCFERSVGVLRAFPEVNVVYRMVEGM